MKTHEVFILCLLILVVGIAIGSNMFLFKMKSHQIFYVDICLTNNKVDITDSTMINQCKQSFEIFRVKG